MAIKRKGHYIGERTLSNNLRSYRKIYNISQEELAQSAGISVDKIKAFEEKNFEELSMRDLFEILNALQVAYMIDQIIPHSLIILNEPLPMQLIRLGRLEEAEKLFE